MLSWLRYFILVLIIMIPIVVIDDVIGNIETIGWRFTVRVLLLVVALAVIRLIPPPVKSP